MKYNPIIFNKNDPDRPEAEKCFYCGNINDYGQLCECRGDELANDDFRREIE